MAALRPRLKACYQSALMRDPGMSGSLKISTTPARDGCHFGTVKVEPQGGFDAEMATCVKAALLQFDLCSSGGDAIKVPLTFGI